jgi:hypothetical protein
VCWFLFDLISTITHRDTIEIVIWWFIFHQTKSNTTVIVWAIEMPQSIQDIPRWCVSLQQWQWCYGLAPWCKRVVTWW